MDEMISLRGKIGVDVDTRKLRMLLNTKHIKKLDLKKGDFVVMRNNTDMITSEVFFDGTIPPYVILPDRYKKGDVVEFEMKKIK